MTNEIITFRPPQPELRVAVCISGQPRHWRACIPWWSRLFCAHGPVHIDLFVHTWNYQAAPHTITGEKIDIPDEELESLIRTIGPTGFMIEDKSILPIAQVNKYMAPADVSFTWVSRASQHYGILKCAHMKSRLEEIQGFKYDVVVRGRTDLVLPQDPAGLPLPGPKQFWSSAQAFAEYPNPASDVFYYAGSEEFDLVASYFDNMLNYFADQRPAEHVFGDFVASRGLDLNIMPIPVMVYRKPEDIMPPGRALWPWEYLA